MDHISILKNALDNENYQKLSQIKNHEVHKFIAKFIEHCNPSEVFVCTDKEEDIQYIREEAIRNGEEKELAHGHTVHFDGYYDQARDRENTKFLLPSGALTTHIKSIDKDFGLQEIYSILKDIMRGHKLYVLFFCLGPTNSIFSIPCLQLTDSSYVAHSEHILYRTGYEEFKRLGSRRFFKFVHSEGELTKNKVSKNIDKRRIYIDLEDETVYSVNTQYAGNTIGLKKLALRLAINRASKEGWLAEHMFIMGVHGPNRKTYFTGAFPSMCGKTSTCMLLGETVVGDDIAYLRNINNEVRAVNVEKGMFGIIQGINSKDDPLIWKALHKPAEIIFSNVLITPDGDVYWNGKSQHIPKEGFNHSGEWYLGKVDSEGNKIPPSHKNARFTFELKILDNVDPELNNPNGVAIRGIIYGGRDSDTWVPVEESFDWVHGVITKGASLESETTAATLGREGIRRFDPMANLDFLSVPLGKYIECYLKFGSNLKNPPIIFSVNYFLKDKSGKFLNEKRDKAVWLKWMELRVHKEVEAIRTPTGFIPLYKDLKTLFDNLLHKSYSYEDYVKQFTLRVPEHLAKIDRIIQIYKGIEVPKILFKVLEEQKQRLIIAKQDLGDYIPPDKFL